MEEASESDKFCVVLKVAADTLDRLALAMLRVQESLRAYKANLHRFDAVGDISWARQIDDWEEVEFSTACLSDLEGWDGSFPTDDLLREAVEEWEDGDGGEVG